MSDLLNFLRLSGKGDLLPWQLSLRPALASGGWGPLAIDFSALIKNKPEHHLLSTESAPHTLFAMSNIGG